MLRQSGRLGQTPGGSNAFPSDFYNAINRGDREGAMLSIREEAGLPDGTPSPRAQELVENGEWDGKRMESLRCLGLVNCAGFISGDSKRFCGKLRCVIAAHKKAGGIPPGWYMTASPKCYQAKPVLPIEANGGPITSGGAALLSQTTLPFELSKGQWRFVMEAWLEKSLAVASLGSEEPGDGDEPGQETGAVWHMPNMSQWRDDEDDEGGNAYAAEPEVGARVPPRLAVDTNLDRSERQEDRAAQELGELVRRLMRDVTGLKEREYDLETQLDLLRTEHGGLTGDLARAQTELGAMRTHVGHMIGRVQRMEDDRGSSGQDVQASVDALSFDLLDPQGTIARMKRQISELNDKFDSGGGVTCHGVAFGSQTEFVKWYKLKGITNHAIFMDAVAVLHSITDAVVSDEQYNKTRESQTKNEFDNSLESTMVSSFNTMVPSGLIGGRVVKEGGAAAVQLKRCMATFDVWEPIGMERGLSHEIVTGVGAVSQEVSEYQASCTNDPEVRLLAQGLLGDSVNFCRELVLFVSVQNKHLTQGTKYTKEQVWGMQLDIILQILSELSQQRRGLATSARKEPALYAWAMLKARVIQERLRANKFEDDPSLNGIIMRKIMLQGGSDALKVKIDKIDEVAKKVADYHRINNSDVKSLQDRISKLEKK
jgi:hypothetical protein